MGRMSEMMRAVVIREPGPPDVLELREVPRPRPGPGEALVRVSRLWPESGGSAPAPR